MQILYHRVTIEATSKAFGSLILWIRPCCESEQPCSMFRRRTCRSENNGGSAFVDRTAKDRRHRAENKNKGGKGDEPPIRYQGDSLAGSLGKRMASLMFGRSRAFTSSLSIPMPHPPWGGIPYLKDSR